MQTTATPTDYRNLLHLKERSRLAPQPTPFPTIKVITIPGDGELIKASSAQTDDESLEEMIERFEAIDNKLFVPDLTAVTEDGAERPNVALTNRRVQSSKSMVLDKWSEYPMAVWRTYKQKPKPSTERTHISNALKINSEILKDAIRHCMQDYPFLSLHEDIIEIREPYIELFHYRNELFQYMSDNGRTNEQRQEFHLLKTWMEEKLRDIIKAFDTHSKRGEVAWDQLWTLYKPNDVMYSNEHGLERCYRLHCMTENVLTLLYWSYQGGVFGCAERTMSITPFRGVKKIEDLDVIPLRFLSDDKQKELQQALTLRGQQWRNLCSVHHSQYDGIAWQYGHKSSASSLRYQRTEYEEKKLWISGRVMVDNDTFENENPDALNNLSKSLSVQNQSYTPDIAQRGRSSSKDGIFIRIRKKDAYQISEQQALITSPFVYGFSLSDKVWIKMFVDKIRDIDWDGQAFTKLSIQESAKTVIGILVNEHEKSRLEFRDVVARKGLGRVFLLHGPPGCGKTLTAETISEQAQKPLYSITSGELGTAVSKAETALTKVFRLAQEWSAILLIDEADVFLAKRIKSDIERNAFVSVFLRSLEYYQGLMILTTNRKHDFDDAFESRIHVTIKFNEPDVNQRILIWKSLFQQFQPGVDFNEPLRHHLGAYELNGRQIKNLFSTALAMFSHSGQSLIDTLDMIYALNRESHEAEG